jgi:hypothetical protein
LLTQSKTSIGIVPVACATTLSVVQGIAGDQRTLYWTDLSKSSVFSHSKIPSATPPGTVATGQASPGPIAVGASWVVWATSNSIVAAAKSSSAVSTVAQASAPSGVATDDASVYWVAGSAAYTTTLPAGSGAIARVDLGATTTAIALDALHLYVATDTGNGGLGTIVRVNKPSAGAPSPAIVAQGPWSPVALVVDAKAAYWTTLGGDVMTAALP